MKETVFFVECIDVVGWMTGDAVDL